MNVLVFGNASCGKSQRAENLCHSLGGNLVYVACMRPFGEEAHERIRRHRAQRAGLGFQTIECPDGLGAAIADDRTLGATALLEDLGNAVANQLFGSTGRTDSEAVQTALLGELDQLAQRCAHLVVVGNEVGCDGIDYDAETAAYQRLLGRITRAWAGRCDLVAECTAGIPHALAMGGERGNEPVA